MVLVWCDLVMVMSVHLNNMPRWPALDVHLVMPFWHGHFLLRECPKCLYDWQKCPYEISMTFSKFHLQKCPLSVEVHLSVSWSTCNVSWGHFWLLYNLVEHRRCFWVFWQFCKLFFLTGSPRWSVLCSEGSVLCFCVHIALYCTSTDNAITMSTIYKKKKILWLNNK